MLGRPPIDLTVERRVAPIGLDEPRPRLSWRPAPAASSLQGAYQIQVADEPASGGSDRPRTRLLWDSGRIASGSSTLVSYDGPVLASRQRVRWRVRTWPVPDAEVGEGAEVGADRVSSWSAWSAWEMGLLSPEHWVGRWIGHRPIERRQGPEHEDYVAPGGILRRDFHLSAAPRRARLYITALGLYEASLNAARVGDRRLDPGWTDYASRIEYQAYDVTGHLRAGPNTLAVSMGSGWYSGHIGWFGRARYGDVPALLCQLDAELADASRFTLATDETWLAHPGGTTLADILMGEHVDLRLEPDAWGPRANEDDGWLPVRLLAGTGGRLVAARDDGIGIIDEVDVVPSDPTHEGVRAIDAGRNIAGVVRLVVRGRPGDIVTVEHGEERRADGRLYRDNLRTAQQLDRYTLVGSGDEVLEPRFTYHGFRHADIHTSSPTVRIRSSRIQVWSSARRILGEFECSSALLNALHANIVTSLNANFMSIPTDCPQRDERLGWSGDIAAFAGTALFIADVAQSLEKWLADLQDGQARSGAYPDFAPNAGEPGWGNAGWADAGLIVPWLLHRHTGDVRVLERSFESMRAYVRYLAADHTGGVRDAGRHGDWLSLGPDTPLDFIGTAYLVHSSALFGRIARVLGRPDEVAWARRLEQEARAAFGSRFVRPDGGLRVDTQTAHALAIAFDLLPARARRSAGARLAELIRSAGYHLRTGFLGVAHVLPALSRTGQHRVACRVALQEEAPSWGFQVRHGATSIWERWDGIGPDGGYHDPAMNSFNHYAFGSIGEWMYRELAGFRAARPGLRHTWLHIRPDSGVDRVRARHESLYGSHVCEWAREGDRLRVSVHVPSNTTASVVLQECERAGLRLDGRAVTIADERSGDTPRVSLEAGSHKIEAPIRPASLRAMDLGLPGARPEARPQQRPD